MGHTYACHRYHVIFSTKHRANLIPRDWLERMHAYIGGVIGAVGAQPLGVGGTTNHVHLLLGLGPAVTVSEIVNRIKSNSSKWARQAAPVMDAFAWQEGYGSFTVSASNVPAVQEYIRKQEEHHQSGTFEQEFIAFLERHGVEYDPKYVFD
jgi:REP element-mobilizing transposase RayT